MSREFEPWFHYEVASGRDGYPEVRAYAKWHVITWPQITWPQSPYPVELTEETLPELIADAAGWAQGRSIDIAGLAAVVYRRGPPHVMALFVGLGMTIHDEDGNPMTVTMVDRTKEGGVVMDGTLRLTWDELASKLYPRRWKLP